MTNYEQMINPIRTHTPKLLDVLLVRGALPARKEKKEITAAYPSSFLKVKKDACVQRTSFHVQRAMNTLLAFSQKGPDKNRVNIKSNRPESKVCGVSVVGPFVTEEHAFKRERNECSVSQRPLRTVA